MNKRNYHQICSLSLFLHWCYSFKGKSMFSHLKEISNTDLPPLQNSNSSEYEKYFQSFAMRPYNFLQSLQNQSKTSLFISLQPVHKMLVQTVPSLQSLFRTSQNLLFIARFSYKSIALFIFLSKPVSFIKDLITEALFFQFFPFQNKYKDP